MRPLQGRTCRCRRHLVAECSTQSRDAHRLETTATARVDRRCTADLRCSRGDRFQPAFGALCSRNRTARPSGKARRPTCTGSVGGSCRRASTTVRTSEHWYLAADADICACGVRARPANGQVEARRRTGIRYRVHGPESNPTRVRRAAEDPTRCEP